MSAYGGGVKGMVTRARREAQRRSQSPSTAHLLLVMLRSDDETASLLADHGVRESELLGTLKVIEAESAGTLDRALERAQQLARVFEEPEVRPIHLLLCVMRDPRSAAHRSLARIGAGPEKVQEGLLAHLGAPASRSHGEGGPSGAPRDAGRVAPHLTPRRPAPPRPPADPRKNGRGTAVAVGLSALPPDAPRAERRPTPPRGRRAEPPPVAEALAPVPVALAEPSAPAAAPLAAASPFAPTFELDPELCPLLTRIGRNLTAEAARGRIDPVIGRDAEIEQLLDVLSRRRSNNPILVGPPGVGKTAIVEGLALRLAAGGTGVRGLEGRVLIEVSAGGLVSGTGVRGALSDRIRSLRKEVDRCGGRVILFIDEIHAVVGGDGPDDLGHELKAALARGDLPCVGATTDAEYRRHFERDPALARRFSPIHVDEPSPSSAAAILRGIAPQYELHHAVAYMPDAIDAAVELSVRYLPEQKLPDKAISVMDLAAARVRRRGGAVVDLAAVAAVIGEQARVPAERLLLRDAERLLALEAILASKVVGHRDALVRIADALRKGAAGFRGNRPLGTFLLLGPTGVGKTETAKAVAEVFFPGAPMTRVDMSELSEAHAVARLLGAPPGYVGHDDGGQLTEPVRRRPYQLVLLDEIEKAHPEVLLALLPLLDEGRLTDGRGRTVDFKNTIIVLTSNLGAGAPVDRSARIGFGGDAGAAGRASEAERVLAAAQRALPPELWNRIDEPLYFGPLSSDEVATIARRMLAAIGAQLEREKGVLLEVVPSAIDTLVQAGGFDVALGARPMRRTIGRLVEAPLAEAILAGRLRAGDVVRLEGDGAKIRLETAGTEAAE